MKINEVHKREIDRRTVDTPDRAMENSPMQWKCSGCFFIDFKKHLSVSQIQYKASNPGLQWLCTEMDMRLSKGSETVYCCQRM